MLSFRKRASVDGEVDYSHGFPTGFTEGLPTFDFSRPMTAGSKSTFEYYLHTSVGQLRNQRI